MIRNESALLLFFFCALALGCSHQVLIESDPPGADLYVDGTKVGITPFSMTDTVAGGNRYEIVLQKQGYQIVQRTLVQDQFSWPKGLASIGCGTCTLGLGCLGLIWSWQLDDRYHYTLQPLPAQATPASSQPAEARPESPTGAPESGKSRPDESESGESGSGEMSVPAVPLVPMSAEAPCAPPR